MVMTVTAGKFHVAMGAADGSVVRGVVSSLSSNIPSNIPSSVPDDHVALDVLNTAGSGFGGWFAVCILSLFTSTFQLALHRSANAPPDVLSADAASTAAALGSYGPLCAVVRPVGWLVCGGGVARGC